ncbi:axoneme-associated protein mst101(2)-like [Mercenaria mercenaria]|uniref:axoneme-associated protein mst101(2)-like n=1 Tax=Mercenaria mercenaria TaxID=6596 RepID=UPI00234E7B30|nr:axoneme-associated protein mst101(2)-like [Mercenaria mercenaria]
MFSPNLVGDYKKKQHKISDLSSPPGADSPSRPVTRSQSVDRTELETDQSYIDVVNLSNQLVSMEILPPKDDSKKSRKRVRFELPDNVDEAAPADPKRGKSPDVKNVKKFCIKKTILRKFHPYLGQRKVEPSDKICVENQSNPLLQKSNPPPAVEEPESNEPMVVSDELADNPALDKNDNCTVRSDRAKTTKRPSLHLKKCRSDSVIFKRKYQRYTRHVKERKHVVSKKSWIKTKEVTIYKLNRKRKHGDYRNSTLKKAKKRKLSGAQLKAKGRNKRLVKKNRGYRTTKLKKIVSKYHVSKRKPVKSKSSSKVKHKIKRAAGKVRKTKKAVKKMSRLKKRLKKTAQKKLVLKKALAKKRKQKKKQKKKVKVAKRRTDKQRRKRRRKD